VDAFGTCCRATGKIVATGKCCYGNIDSCGVCNGDGSACNVAAKLDANTPASVTGRRLASAAAVRTFVADPIASFQMKKDLVAEAATNTRVPASAISVTLQEEGGNIKASLEFNQAAIAASGGDKKPVDALDVAATLGVGTGALIKQVGAVEAESVCGNGVCEPGESCQGTACTGGCKADCPFTRKQCPTAPWANGGECSGRGTCIAMSGACECFTAQGYVGAACSQCAKHYIFDDATKSCVVDVASLPTPSPTASPTASPTKSPTASPTKSPTASPTKSPTKAPTGAPTPHTPAVRDAYENAVRFTTGLGGFGVDTFDEVAKSAFRRALSVELSVSTTEISILNPVATTGRRRQLAASGVKFDVEVLAKSDAAAARIKSDVDTKVKAPEFKNKVKAELNAAWTHAGKTDAEKKALYNEDNFNAFDVAAATKPAAVGLATPTTTTEAPATTAAAATEDDKQLIVGLAAGLGAALLLAVGYIARDRQSDKKQAKYGGSGGSQVVRSVEAQMVSGVSDDTPASVV
jgi:hypothetical protein